ncbi:MAG: integration host factor [Frankiales bacterium]|nr:integration host factor [Frankiales bacterium]
MSVNRAQLIAAVAESAGVSQSDADSVLKAFETVISDNVAKGEKVALTGFLTFEQVDRAAREGRNPSTGETIQIAATKAVKVSAGSKLKAAASGK